MHVLRSGSEVGLVFRVCDCLRDFAGKPNLSISGKTYFRATLELN